MRINTDPTTQPPNHPTPACVLAVDPGRAKCGVAVVDQSGAVLHREIISTPDVPATLSALAERFDPQVILIGDGTGSAPVEKAIAALSLAPSLLRVDEKHTSELARARFLKENPARGLERLMPQGLRTPNAAYDDYVAIILAERWLAERMKDEG